MTVVAAILTIGWDMVCDAAIVAFFLAAWRNRRNPTPATARHAHWAAVALFVSATIEYTWRGLVAGALFTACCAAAAALWPSWPDGTRDRKQVARA